MNSIGTTFDGKNYMKKRVSNYIDINSLLIAMLLIINYIVGVLNIIISLPNLLTILCIIIFIFTIIRNKFMIKKKHILFFLITGVQVILTLLIYNMNSNFQIKFILGYLLNSILIVYVVSFNYNFNKICKYISVIFTILIWSLLFFKPQSYDPGSMMGRSYSILPFFLASIYYLSGYVKDKKINKIIIFTSNIIYIISMYKFLTRGVVLSITVYLYLLYIFNILSSSKNFKKVFFILVSSIIIVIVFLNFTTIITEMNSFLLNNNIKIKFLNKMVILLDENNLDNGRFLLYKISWNSFKKNPILGNGIGALDRLHGINYDHSLILQLLNEGGIIFFIIHISIIIKGLIIILKKFNEESNISHFLLLLLCNSLIRLSVSSTFWLDQGYWMFLYISFSYNSLLSKKRTN